ncbi:MAG: hypothetical protein E7Z92_03165 [Cyanobacteria bacterium SIG31]|nr:hypothetical protein [Cyanobacteria bacterium SIG31]
MGLNITHTNSFQFENRENLRNTARDLLAKQGASQEASNKILEQTIFNQTKPEASYAPHLAIIKASSQISVNNTLKETLKYLKSHSGKKTAKEPVLGELWNLFNKEELNYQGELADFEIDNSIANIFAA